MLILRSIWRFLRFGFLLVLLAVLCGSSVLPPGDRDERVRAFTRQIEFDYIGWTIDALRTKLSQSALSSDAYLPEAKRKQAVLDYLALVRNIQQAELELDELFADPNVKDAQTASADLRLKLEDLYQQRRQQAPLVESVLQSQIGEVVGSAGLTIGGQPLPPVMFHSTPLPLAMIVSPRNIIKQEMDISLLPDLTVDQQEILEDRVDKALNLSTLVVPVGGVGVYPTMVYQTGDIGWLIEVVAHEWVHNFLTLRPLGMNYFTRPELRTMNETTATIAGKEIGRAVLERYYPELLPPEPVPSSENHPPDAVAPVEEFSFNKEMRITRENVDKMLEEGKVEDAEAYMEERRELFWEQGYHIRKLNQAYFAFYGAYADVPGGAAGTDPVGTAVRALRKQSPSLSAFLKKIAWMWSVEQLYKVVGTG